MNIRAEVQAGVCGLGTVIRADSADGTYVRLRIESDCPKVQALSNELTEVDAIEQVLTKSLVETTPVLLAVKHRLHTSCLVPVGILKAIESAAGLALPSVSTIELKRVEE